MPGELNEKNLLAYYPLDGNFDDLTWSSQQISDNRYIRDNSLLAYYQLNNSNDYFGNYNLTNTNGVSFSSGLFGNGADFGTTNTNKELYINSNLGTSNSGDITVSFWAKLHNEISSDTQGFFLQNTLGYNKPISLYYEYNSGTRRVRIDSGGGTLSYYASLGTGWNHFVVTRSSGATKLFVNGLLVSSGTTSTGTYGANRLYIGSLGGYNYFNGIIDDFAVFYNALNEDEVAYIYRGGTGTSFGASFVPSLEPGRNNELCLKTEGTTGSYAILPKLDFTRAYGKPYSGFTFYFKIKVPNDVTTGTIFWSGAYNSTSTSTKTSLSVAASKLLLTVASGGCSLETDKFSFGHNKWIPVIVGAGNNIDATRLMKIITKDDIKEQTSNCYFGGDSAGIYLGVYRDTSNNIGDPLKFYIKDFAIFDTNISRGEKRQGIELILNQLKYKYKQKLFFTFAGQIIDVSDSQLMSEGLLSSIVGKNVDTQTQSDYQSLVRAVTFLVSDNAITSENKSIFIHGLNVDNVISQELKLLNINSKNTETSTSSENVSTIRVMVINVDDTSTSSENTIFNISTYLTEIQSLTDNSLNKIELTKQETISSSDTELINTLANNVDIIYTTDSGGATQLLLSRIKPGVVGLDRVTPSILKATKHKPLVQ